MIANIFLRDSQKHPCPHQVARKVPHILAKLVFIDSVRHTKDIPGRNDTNLVHTLESYKVTDAYFRMSPKVGVYKAPIGPKPAYHTIHIESTNNGLELPKQLAVLNTRNFTLPIEKMVLLHPKDLR
jgi:hypothetical protein